MGSSSLLAGAILHRPRMERERDTELRFHIDAYADELIRGASRRSVTGANFLDSMVQDIRVALRMFRTSPGFAIAAVLTIATRVDPMVALRYESMKII